jgi:thymidylate synthase ThyX
MKIIEPSVELFQQQNVVSHVARCARVCYGKEEGNDQKLYDALKLNKHHSMFRHETHYFIAPMNDFAVEDIITFYHKDIGFDYKTHKGKCYIVLNGQWCINHKQDYKYLTKYETSVEEFNKLESIRNLIRYTFCLTTQISTTRELNRTSPNNIAERSTRYVEEGAICRPHWMDIEGNGSVWSEMYKDISITRYIDGCEHQFNNYKSLINQGMKKEDARGLLPLDTASKVVYTYNIDEWRNIINLRYHGSTGRPHPNAKLIIGLVKNKLEELNYKL